MELSGGMRRRGMPGTRAGRALACAAMIAAGIAGVLAIATRADAAERPPLSGADEERGRRAVALLQELVRLPSVSDRPEGVEQAASWIEGKLRALGLTTRRIQPADSPNPILFADLPATGSGPSSRPAPVVLFYIHYDTQPTGPEQDWGSTGGDPFAGKLLSRRWDEEGVEPLRPEQLQGAAWRGARLYGRGVADDKAPVIMHLMALEEYVRLASRPLHVKFLLDGEEEAGSEPMGAALAANKDLLRADLLVLCDGPMDALDRPSVYLGTRGDMHARLTLRTATRSAHSGNYSLLPNAAFRLAALLGTMKDRSGRVLVEGFEAGADAPTLEERATLARASEAEPAIRRELGTERFDGDPQMPYYERFLFHPSLIVNHMTAGRPGNQVPVMAEAVLEARLVTRQDPREVFEALKRHVAKHEPEAQIEWLDGVAAARMDPREPAIAWGIAAIRRAAGGDLLVYPSLGGTLPLLHDFGKAGFRFVGLPLVNYDNSQHVANENLRVEVLPRGIAILSALYRALGEGEAPPAAR